MGEIGRRLRFVLFPVNTNRCMRLFDGLNAGYRQAPVVIRRIGIAVRAQHRLRSSVKRTPNSQPVHQAAKGVRVKAQDGSRASGPAYHPCCSLKHPQNMLPLDFFE